MPSETSTRISLIAAVARNGVIGRDNALIWHIPSDLAHFKKITHGHPILMGRRTWESIERALPGRRNIVVTRQEDWHGTGAESAASLQEALRLCAEAPEVFVIGGAQMYAEALPLAQRLWLTEIDAEPEGHARFPDWPRDAFEELSREHHEAQGSLPAFDFVLYQRLARTPG